MLDPDISTADALALLCRPEQSFAGADQAATLDRRRFLQLVGMGAGAGMLAASGGSLLDTLIPGYDPSAWAAGPVRANDGILVIVGMFGGNDGLNSVVALNDSNYRTQHGALAILPGDTLALDRDVGLHPELTELKSWWDRGQLAIVEGIGYPNPDLSHFNSMAYWMSGRPGQIPTSGWIGRWLDRYLGSTGNLFAAAEVGNSVPLHLIGERHRGTGVPARKPDFGTETDARSLRTYAAIRNMRTTANGPWFGAVGQAFVDYLDVSKTLAPVIPADAQLPTVDIVKRLEIAARLVNANLGFRVVTAGFGDFDSHAGQPDQHGTRMRELNAAIARFFAVLDPKWATRVTLMTFSEFGRTPWSNDGQGTDHGTSAPHFVIGRNVAGGRYGQRPTLAGLARWDRMGHHVDLRTYYASILDGWMGGGASEIVGGPAERLALFARGPGVAPPAAPPPPPGPGGPVVVPGQTPAGSSFVPIAPTRVADTRDGTLVRAGVIPAGATLRVPVAGVGPIPASGVNAVVANVTAVGATEAMYFTVHPSGTPRPFTSNLNAVPGRPVPNLVVMGVGADGCLAVFNSHGATHCVVDVFGYFRSGPGDLFTPIAPKRLFDTRTGLGVRPGKLGDSEAVEIAVAGAVGVPAGATAVVMNLTVAEPDTDGFLRLRPSGTPAELTSNVNFAPGDVVPNLVMCRLGAGGRVTLDGTGAGKHALGDVFGYFGATGSRMQPVAPSRLFDTRDGTGVVAGPIGPHRAIDVVVAGRFGVPANATAAILNVTATNVAGPSHVTVWPAGSARPDTSNLNVVGGQTVANLVLCRIGAGGQLSFANPLQQCDVLADVLGYFA